MRTSFTKQSAMTLLEVMVAMAVFATAGLAVMKSASENISSVSYLEDKVFSSWIAENNIVELRVTKKYPGKSWAKGESELAGRTWFWRRKAEATTSADFLAITVEVATDASFKNRVSHLQTYVLRDE